MLFNFQLSRSSNIARFDKLNQLNDDKLKYARWEYGPQKRVLVSPQLFFFSEKDWIKSGKIILSLQTFSESRIQRKFDELTRKTQKEEVQVYSLNGDFKGKIFNTDDLSYGVEVTHNTVESNAFSQDIEILENSVDYEHQFILHGIDALAGRVPVTELLTLREIPGVVMIELDGILTIANSDARAGHGVDMAFEETGYDGTGSTVAIIDTGLDGNHTSLDDQDDDPLTDDPKIIGFYDPVNNPGNTNGTDFPSDD